MRSDQIACYSLRVSRVLLRKFGYVADYEGRTSNRELEQLMRRHVKEYEEENGEITKEMLDAFYAKKS